MTPTPRQIATADQYQASMRHDVNELVEEMRQQLANTPHDPAIVEIETAHQLNHYAHHPLMRSGIVSGYVNLLIRAAQQANKEQQ